METSAADGPGASPGPEHGFSQFLQNLMALLADDDPNIVKYAARALREHDNAEVRQGLLIRLAACPEGCIGEVVSTLEILFGAASGELFEQLTVSPNAEVRVAAVERIARRLPPERWEAVWSRLLVETDARCRASLLSVLGVLRPPLTSGQLDPFLSDGDSRVRSNALELLERLSGPLDLERVAPLLNDPAPRVRASAMRLLWPSRGDELWKTLQDELTSPDLRCELAAVYLLGQIPGPADAMQALEERLKGPNPQVKLLASKSLLTAPGTLACSTLCALYMVEESAVVRKNLMAYCRRNNPDLAVNILGGILTNHELELQERATAARGLGELAHPKAIPVLMMSLSDEDPRIRSNVVEALAHCPCDGMMEMLLPSLDDSSSRVQATAALAVWRLGGREAIDVLLKMLRSGDSKKQSSAAFALGEIGSAELVAPLSRLMDELSGSVVTTEAQRHVQKNVMRALTRIRGG